MSDNRKELWIAIDFDGTLNFVDQFPECGEPNPYAIEVIKRFKRDWHKVIFNTCRRNESLQTAVEWMKLHDIEPDSVNDNPWSRAIFNDPGSGQKVFAHIYIDDSALGIKKTKNRFS